MPSNKVVLTIGRYNGWGISSAGFYTEESNRAILGSFRCHGKSSTLKYFIHLGRFAEPVRITVLYDADCVYPQVTIIKTPDEMDCVLEEWWQCCQGKLPAKVFQVIRHSSQRHYFPPAVAQCYPLAMPAARGEKKWRCIRIADINHSCRQTQMTLRTAT